MIKRYGPHFLWLGVCVVTWFVARGVYQQDEAGGKRARVGSTPAPRVEKRNAEPGKDGAVVVSSSLATDFDFPAEWDAKQCVRKALGELNEYRRMQMFQRAMQRLTKESAATMQEVFSEYDKSGRWFIGEYGFFLRRWGEIDGKAAADFVVHRGGSDQAGWTGYVKRTLAGWVANDPDGAVNWINTKENLSDWVVSSSIHGVIEGLTEQNPERAMAFALSQAGERGRNSYFSTLTESLIYGPGMARAEEWLEKIPAEGELADAKRRVFAQIVDRQVRGGADAAAALALKYADQPWVDAGSVQRIAKGLSSDSAKYDAWFKALPAGPVRDGVAATVRGQ
jgi:hypothetical protein